VVEWRRGDDPEMGLHGEPELGHGCHGGRAWRGRVRHWWRPRRSRDGRGGPRGRGDGEGVEG